MLTAPMPIRWRLTAKDAKDFWLFRRGCDTKSWREFRA
jgi:hypothetical protein